jgi:hypothetical protein
MISSARVLLIVILALSKGIGTSLSASLLLGWDPSPDPEVFGYYIYYGADRHHYTNSVAIGLPNTTATLSNLEEGVTYYLAVTSFNWAGFESEFSEEVVYHPVLSPTPPRASIKLENLEQAYDGTAKQVSITTMPPGLTVMVTYNGSTDLPTESGVYGINASITDARFVGDATNTLFITNQSPKPDVAGGANVPPTNAVQALLLSWSTSSNAVALWQSTDLASWTPVTNELSSSNSIVIPQRSLTRFFRGCSAGTDETDPMPLSIRKL